MRQVPTLSPLAAPPPLGETLESSQMQQMLYQLYERTAQNGIVGERLRISSPRNGEAKFENHNFYQGLVTLNMGLYSDWTTDQGMIAYGFACNVRRSDGSAITVGGQINAWGGTTQVARTQQVFGANLVALGPKGHIGSLIACEVSPVPFGDDSLAPKIGIDNVFIIGYDRGLAPVLGANLYNYYSSGTRYTAIPRGPNGEYCGWAVCEAFLSGCMDLQNAPNWSGSVTYGAGQLVFDASVGRYYKAIFGNTNNLPSASPAFWVLHLDNKAIGIDFSSIDVTTLSRIGSAIRVRDTMRIDYNAEGTIGQLYDPNTNMMVLVSNLALGAAPADRVIEVDATTGGIYRFGVLIL